MSEILNIWHSAPDGEELTKAMLDDMQRKQKAVPKSAIIDPLQVAHQGGTRDKPTPIPYSTLRRMGKIPAVAAIIQTRLNQVARYARRPTFEGDTGFRIALKDHKKTMSEAEKKRAYEIEEFFLQTGWKRNKVRKDNFNMFLRKIVRDSLEIDAMTFEVVPDARGNVAELWAVDAATIELIINNPVGEGDYDIPVYKPDTKRGMKDAGDLAYIQKLNGRAVAEFTEEELAYAIRNPRTDVRYTDFGLSEMEMLIEIITGIVNGVRYNTSYFSHSSLPQGILEIVGKYDDKHLESFKKHWRNLTTGASGKWSVPIMALEDGQGLKFTNFKNSNRDMEFNEFLEFLFNIACAVYQIDPNEVGFKSWTSANSMSASDNTAEKMAQSKDKGFVPLMHFLSDTFNSEIMNHIDEKYVFEWIGVAEEDEDKKLERQKTMLEMGRKTVNELRKENDEDEIEEDWANAPANPQLIQVYMADKNQKIQEEQGAKQQEQEAANKEHEAAQGALSHERQKEIMDKQHEQTLEHKQLDQEHQVGIEGMKQEHQTNLTKEQAKQQKAQKPLKKSFEDEDTLTINVDWADY